MTFWSTRFILERRGNGLHLIGKNAAAYHTSAVEVGRIAAHKVVLYHLMPMGQSDEEVLSEVRQNWTGETIYAKDLDVIR